MVFPVSIRMGLCRFHWTRLRFWSFLFINDPRGINSAPNYTVEWNIVAKCPLRCRWRPQKISRRSTLEHNYIGKVLTVFRIVEKLFSRNLLTQIALQVFIAWSRISLKNFEVTREVARVMVKNFFLLVQFLFLTRLLILGKYFFHSCNPLWKIWLLAAVLFIYN